MEEIMNCTRTDLHLHSATAIQELQDYSEQIGVGYGRMYARYHSDPETRAALHTRYMRRFPTRSLRAFAEFYEHIKNVDIMLRNVGDTLHAPSDIKANSYKTTAPAARVLPMIKNRSTLRHPASARESRLGPGRLALLAWPTHTDTDCTGSLRHIPAV